MRARAHTQTLVHTCIQLERSGHKKQTKSPHPPYLMHMPLALTPRTCRCRSYGPQWKTEWFRVRGEWGYDMELVPSHGTLQQ